jgi:hypothetical protein
MTGPQAIVNSKKKLVLLVLLVVLFVLSALPTSAAERWEVLPSTPAAIPSERSG